LRPLFKLEGHLVCVLGGEGRGMKVGWRGGTTKERVSEVGEGRHRYVSYILVLLRGLSYSESLGVGDIPLSESRCRWEVSDVYVQRLEAFPISESRYGRNTSYD